MNTFYFLATLMWTKLEKNFVLLKTTYFIAFKHQGNSTTQT